jgi:hypothetical protein
LTSAAEAIAPAPNAKAQNPAHGEAKPNAARGKARMSAIAWPMAAILARSMTGRETSGHEKIRRVLSRERDPGQRAG